jgi:hypothetical protein
MGPRLENGKAAPVAETTSERGPGIPAPNRKPIYLILAIAVVCLVTLAVYLVLREPASSSDTGITASNITASSATISWTTGKPLASQVEYGTTPAYGSLSMFRPEPATSHSVNLTGLTPGTTYYCAALSTDSAGKVSTSVNLTFTTGATHRAAGAPQISKISSITASAITADSATINWTTDQPSMSQVAYGATTSYGSLSAFSNSPVTDHSVRLTALTAGKTYNYAALSTNSDGQTSTSPNFTFTTASAAGTPSISNVKTSGITTNSVTINWNTDQASTSQVAYGPTTAYGRLSVFGSPMVTAHSITVSGLSPGKTYDFSALSANATGQVGTSANSTVTTLAGPPGIEQVFAKRTADGSATITWITDQPSTSQVKYGARSILRLLHRHTYDLLSTRDSSLVTAHSVTLIGLSPKTTYNFVVVSTNAQGEDSSSSNLTF